MDTANATTAKSARLSGLVLIAAACTSAALLLIHPDENAASFADVLRNEAAGRAVSALVHGGMIVVLIVELAALAILVARMAAERPAAIAGYVFFTAGAAFLSASLLTDGLVIPAIAAKYVTAPAAKLDDVKSLFVLCGSAIGVLMPAGLALLALGGAGFSMAVWSTSRAVGALGVVVAFLIVAAIGATAPALNPFVVMGGLAGIALWLACMGTLATRGRI